MGFLAQGMGFGSAGAAASSSLGWGATGTALGAVGSLMTGVGGFQQALYQSQVARNSASIMRANATAATSAGRYEESASKLRTGQLESAQLAAQGANGVDVGVGSPVAVRQSTADIGAMDAAMIHYNAARQAYGMETEASSLDAQAKLDKMAGTGMLASGAFNAGSTLISGASSLGSKWVQYKLSGAQ